MRAFTLLLDRRGFPFLLTAALALFALVGCGSSDNGKNPVEPVTPTPTTFTKLHGIFAGASDGGRISLSIAAGTLAGTVTRDQTVPVTGTIIPTGGEPVTLGGVYNPATDTLLVGAQGWALLGVYEPSDPFPSISGNYHSPAGPGTFGCAVGESTAVRIFIGTFIESNQTISGPFNMASVGGVIAGAAFQQGGTEEDYLFFKGTIEQTGYPRAIALHGVDDESVFDAVGEWNPNTDGVGGHWSLVDNSKVPPVAMNGTWEGIRVP